mmetsp:Transcript_31093/g.58323  ORF Transcript_31093/g.58323 Transcript_31093/m.58323 type:complete len:218 (+) Transcript_31093:684-1337(+)
MRRRFPSRMLRPLLLLYRATCAVCRTRRGTRSMRGSRRRLWLRLLRDYSRQSPCSSPGSLGVSPPPRSWPVQSSTKGRRHHPRLPFRRHPLSRRLLFLPRLRRSPQRSQGSRARRASSPRPCAGCLQSPAWPWATQRKRCHPHLHLPKRSRRKRRLWRSSGPTCNSGSVVPPTLSSRCQSSCAGPEHAFGRRRDPQRVRPVSPLSLQRKSASSAQSI